jgi:hypothetical protein
MYRFVHCLRNACTIYPDDSTAERASKRQRLAPFLIEPSSSSSSKATAAAAGSDAAELPEVIVAAKKRNILVSSLQTVHLAST